MGDERAGASGGPGQTQLQRERGRFAIKTSVVDAIVAKDEDVFVLSSAGGEIPIEGSHGLGLYYHDCRFVRGWALCLNGTRLVPLVADASRGFSASFELTNEEISLGRGQLLPPRRVGVKRRRVVEGAGCAVHELISVQSFSLDPVELELSMKLRVEFEDVFAVRGVKASPGRRRRTESEPGKLRFSCEGRDDMLRTLDVELSPAAALSRGDEIVWRFHLAPREAKSFGVFMRVSESRRGAPDERRHGPSPDLHLVEAELGRSVDAWMGRHTQLRSTHGPLTAAAERAILDLRMLASKEDGQEFFSAGLPWYATLFGRDSLIAALEVLAFEPRFAAQTLRILARLQGSTDDPKRAEQPGKIVHEVRVGELARTGEVPFGRYYGTVDATPLFLILLARHADWTGDLGLFQELSDNVERAIGWMLRAMDQSEDGYLRYEESASEGLANQGWKDSDDSIVNADGSLATPPIALVEVQGYAYMALHALAGLYRRADRPHDAERLSGRAEALRRRFNKDFWLEEHGMYALALQAGGAPCAVMSSNPGQALWTGIADVDKAERTVERLMAEDMYSGWGIRTLSCEARRYNPIGYHSGTVWPHDNAIIAAGCRRYGADEAACRIMTGILDIANHLDEQRLPELIAGFRRADFARPVGYPTACRPQAWAAGSIPFLIQSLLGLTPEAFERRLRIVRPRLPCAVGALELCRLRVGGAEVDLRFERTPHDATGVQVLRVSGELDIVVEQDGSGGGA